MTSPASSPRPLSTPVPAEAAGSQAARWPTLVACVRSVIAYVVIAAYVLIVAPPGILLAFVFRWKGILYLLGHGGIALALALVGIRYRVVGRERLLRGRATVYCANHESNVDPPVLFRALHPRLHILFKAELKKVPLLGPALVIGGFVPIDRQDREQSMAAIEEGSQSIRDGNSFLIFPEGTRSRTGALLPFKKGGFIMALKAQAPVVPVAVSGGRDAMRKGSRIIWPAMVTVRVGEAVETAAMSPEDRNRLIAEVRGRIETLLAQGPS